MPIRLMRLTPRRANLRILFSLFSDNLCMPTIDEAQAWLGNALHPTSEWQCGIACASFAGPGSETRLTTMGTARRPVKTGPEVEVVFRESRMLR